MLPPCTTYRDPPCPPRAPQAAAVWSFEMQQLLPDYLWGAFYSSSGMLMQFGLLCQHSSDFACNEHELQIDWPGCFSKRTSAADASAAQHQPRSACSVSTAATFLCRPSHPSASSIGPRHCMRWAADAASHLTALHDDDSFAVSINGSCSSMERCSSAVLRRTRIWA